MTAKTLSSHSGPAPAPVLWHALPAGEVLDKLACDPALGLSAAEVEKRRASEGANALPEAPCRPMLAVFAHQFKSPLIYILFAAAVLAVA
ncbi:MAG: cation-transporting P-type ATPase, partial [Polaromonas sp.]|nr:cation-transporting P-type ATPase [Polaromonas sp.]